MATHVYSLTITSTNSSQIAQNILHYNFDDSGFSTTEAAAAALCSAWDTANRTAMRALLPGATRLVSLKSRAVNQPGGFEAFLALPAAQTGTRAGATCVSGVGPCAVFYHNDAIYRGRGKCFLVGLSDSDHVDGEFTADYQTAFDANKHIFTDPLTLTGGGGPVATPVIYNKRPPPLTTLITHVGLCTYPATQRRRQLPV